MAQLEATDVQKPILSAGRLADSGHTVILDAHSPLVTRPAGEKAPLEMHDGLPYLRAQVVGSAHVPGV